LDSKHQIFISKKMEVIRDSMWSTCLANAVKMYRLREPNEKCYRLADATWKCKMAYIKHSNTKKNTAIVVLDKTPEVIQEQRTQHKICCATTMSGKQCRFKAVCGDYCRKHQVSSTSLGSKTDVSNLLSKLDGIKIQ